MYLLVLANAVGTSLSLQVCLQSHRTAILFAWMKPEELQHYCRWTKLMTALMHN